MHGHEEVIEFRVQPALPADFWEHHLRALRRMAAHLFAQHPLVGDCGMGDDGAFVPRSGIGRDMSNGLVDDGGFVRGVTAVAIEVCFVHVANPNAARRAGVLVKARRIQDAALLREWQLLARLAQTACCVWARKCPRAGACP